MGCSSDCGCAHMVPSWQYGTRAYFRNKVWQEDLYCNSWWKKKVQPHRCIQELRTWWGKSMSTRGHSPYARNSFVGLAHLVISRSYLLDDWSVMKPNTLHFVTMPEHSICYGENFFCTSTMQDMARGIVHSFMDHIKMTNTNHPTLAILLRRIASFYHLGLMKLGRKAFDSEFRCAYIRDLNWLDF